MKILGCIKRIRDKKAIKDLREIEIDFTDRRTENRNFRQVIIDNMKSDTKYTINQICKEFPFGEKLTNPQVCSLIVQLRRNGRIKQVKENGQNYYVKI